MVYCDNITSVIVLNSGRTNDAFLLQCIREICYVSSLCEFTVKAKHLEGRNNRIADLLSRWNSFKNPYQVLQDTVKGDLTEFIVHNDLFNFTHYW